MGKKVKNPIRHGISRALAVAAMAMGLCLAAGSTGFAASSYFPDSDQTGTLTIHNFVVDNYENLKEGSGQSTEIPDGAKAQENVEFSIVKLEDTGTKVTESSPVDSAFAKQTGKTDASGQVKFDLLPKGFYLVTENSPDGYTAQKSRFVVAVPMKVESDKKGSDASTAEVSWNYDVHVYPKNTPGASIEKKVSSTKKVVGVGDQIQWTISYPVPSGIKEVTAGGTNYAKDFYITDTMDDRLDYVENSATITAYDANGKDLKLNLTRNVDYVEKYSAKDHMATWTYTDAGVKKLADNNTANVDLVLLTSVSQRAQATIEAMWNDASIDFTNVSGDPYHMDVFPLGSNVNGENVPKVYLGSITIDKHDSSDKAEKLEGAEFKIALSKQDAEEEHFIQIETDSEWKDYVVKTDEEGTAVFQSLGAGTYYLVETKAPEGYEKLGEPVKVVIGNTKNEANARIAIPNSFTDDNGESMRETTEPTGDTKDVAYGTTPASEQTTTPAAGNHGTNGNNGGGNGGNGGNGNGTGFVKTGDVLPYQIIGFGMIAALVVFLVAKRGKRDEEEK